MTVSPNIKLTHEQANAINSKLEKLEEYKSISKRFKKLKDDYCILERHSYRQEKIINSLTKGLK